MEAGVNQGVQSVGLIIILLVPGGLFLWSYERKSTSYGRREVTDRIVRLAAASVVILTITAPFAIIAYVRPWYELMNGNVGLTWEWVGRWLLACIYLGIIVALGPIASITNQRFRAYLRTPESSKRFCRRHLRRMSSSLLEIHPNPTAFEYLADNGPFIIRVKTKSGDFLAGIYGVTGLQGELEESRLISHLSTNPQSQDIYLQHTILVSDNGKFLFDENNHLRLGQGGTYIGADAIESAIIIAGDGRSYRETEAKE